MPRGYRCILVAFIGWLSLAAINPQQGSGKPTAATDQNISSAADNITATPQQADEPKGYKDPCRTGDDNRNSDLCAQWKAADAARSAANAAWVIGYIGILIGLLTLGAAAAAAWYAKEAAKHTKAGADEAKRAADAAEENLSLANKISEIELRAYIRTGEETYAEEPMEGGGVHYTVRVPFTNVGLTPAQETETQIETRWVTYNTSEECHNMTKPKTSEVIGSGPINWGTVSRDGTFIIYEDAKLASAKAKQLESGTAAVLIDTCTTFNDEFGTKWRYTHNFVLSRHSMETNSIHTSICRTERVHKKRKR
jgi:hypothetical protein